MRTGESMHSATARRIREYSDLRIRNLRFAKRLFTKGKESASKMSRIDFHARYMFLGVTSPRIGHQTPFPRMETVNLIWWVCPVEFRMGIHYLLGSNAV